MDELIPFLCNNLANEFSVVASCNQIAKWSTNFFFPFIVYITYSTGNKHRHFIYIYMYENKTPSKYKKLK